MSTISQSPASVNGNGRRDHSRKPIDLFLYALTKAGHDPHETGSGKWESTCPVHNGSRRNLSIAESDNGTVLLRCHHSGEGGGCTFSAIMAAIGLEQTDGFPEVPGFGRPAKKQRGTYETPHEIRRFYQNKLHCCAGYLWTYRDLDQGEYAAVFRFDVGGKKEYRPAWFDPKLKLWKIGDPPQWLPFRLPEIATAPRIFFFEGEKCANLAALRLGLASTTTSHGADSAHKTDLSALAGKEVILVPDHDKAGEKYVKLLAELLAKVEPPPTIKILRLPGLANEGDDFEQWYDAHKRTPSQDLKAELDQLASDAPAWTPPPVTGETEEPAKISPNEAVDDPSRLARLHLDQKHCHADGFTLRFWQGEFHEWNGAYRPVLIDDLRARVSGTIKVEFDRINIEEIAEHAGDKPPPKARKVTGSTVANSILSLGSYAHLEPAAKSPCWLIDKPPFPARDVLPTRNALVNLPGLVNGDANAIHPPTPHFFCPYSLDYDFDALAPEPANWLGFVRSVWGDDTASIQALQEWFGYLLTPDTRLQKILMLIGPRRSGKGTIARVMKALLGAENVVNPTLSSLGTNFGLAPLIGKPAATITDARLSGRADIAQVVERLLSISGEDGQTIDRKHLPAVTVKLPTRFTMISNELPRLADTSGAMAGRLVILKMTKSFYGIEDTGLEGRIMPELPGILLWAIEGWKRLRERGKFVQPQSAAQLVEEMEDLASPAGMFVKERCDVDPTQEIPVKSLFEAWREWCKEKNREHVGDESSFGRNLRAVMPSLVTKQVKSGRVTYRAFVGINLLVSF